MECRKATLADFRSVKANLSERVSTENEIVIQTYHLDPTEDVKRAIKAGNAETFLAGGEPVGLIAWETLRNEIRTAFMATEGFFEPRPSTLRFSIRKIREIQTRLGGLVVRSSTLSRHPKVGAWYKLLGYQEIPAWPERVFELQPKDVR
jgi:hypothetical protein